MLAIAKKLKAAGKDVIELETGDSPFPISPSAVAAGIQAIRDDRCHYGPSIGLPEFRQAASDYVNREYGLQTTAENVVAGPGAKTFETFFLEAFVNPGDGVLVFSPHFPTCPPNIAARRPYGRVSFAAIPRLPPELDDPTPIVEFIVRHARGASK